MASKSAQDDDLNVTLIGAGTIGLSFAAFHLSHLSSNSKLTILDTREDLKVHITSTLPSYLPEQLHHLVSSVVLSNDLPSAVRDANIIQESGPENLDFKAKLWPQVEQYAPADALLWSSTSGIPASSQAKEMKDTSRLLVVHPYNPPHVMPLLEVVPSPGVTSESVVQRTLDFWKARGREPVVLKKECTGFVANRLAFVLLREAIHLVKEGVVSVEELDTIVTNSMGPRWAVAGPFKSYTAGGGKGGLEAFFANIGGTVQDCWNDAGTPNVGEPWQGTVFSQAEKAYGVVDTAERDRVTAAVLDATKAQCQD